MSDNYKAKCAIENAKLTLELINTLINVMVNHDLDSEDEENIIFVLWHELDTAQARLNEAMKLLGGEA